MQIGIMSIEGNTPIWQLAVDRFTELIQSILPMPKPEKEDDPNFNSK